MRKMFGQNVTNRRKQHLKDHETMLDNNSIELTQNGRMKQLLHSKHCTTKILTFGFDDCEIYDRRLCELFRKYGMTSTFFLISDQLSFQCKHHRYGKDTVVERVSPGELANTYAGMEIATHTANHLCPIDDLENTVVKSLEYLSTLCGYPVKGMAYPGGNYTEEHIKKLDELGILYARTAKSTHCFNLPDQLLAWNPTCKYDDPDILRIVDDFLKYDGNTPVLLYIYGHSYELTRQGNPYDWDSFEVLLEKLSNQEDIWYASNKEIAEWLKYTYRNLRSNH